MNKQNIHNKYIGVWVDHKQAFIITIENKKSDIQKIESLAGAHSKATGGSRSKRFAGEIASESKFNNKYKRHLDIYYDSIISKMQNPTSIVIFGPGEAKRELLKRIEQSYLNEVSISGIVTVDKMTENQILAYVKDFFNVH